MSDDKAISYGNDAFIELNDNGVLTSTFDGKWLSINGDGADLMGRNQLTLFNGDKLTPIFEEADTKYVRPDMVEGKTIIYNGSLNIKDAPLKDGTYCMQFNIKDIRGNTCVTAPVEFEMSFGKIKNAAIPLITGTSSNKTLLGFRPAILPNLYDIVRMSPKKDHTYYNLNNG